ncbi:MAG TPA: cupin domain-containing protein [Amaricoccus sp.]|jgi:uncharacterized cupin superfamily protein|nr:cupin domain-containing protein [Amaricoccus sp.]
MSDSKIVKYGALGNPATSIPGWKVAAGAPEMASYFQFGKPGDPVVSGTWTSTVGTYHTTYDHPTMHEFVHMIEGKLVITPEGGAPVTLSEGDAFMVEPGFVGTWEVVEPVRKHFVLAS